MANGAPALRARVHLRLYVAGGAPRSRRAIELVSRVCARYLPDSAQLEVVDVYRDSALAAEHGVRGVPALVRLAPGPLRRMVGDLGDESTLCSAIIDDVQHAERP
ncbi:MAG: circadian clock KaiB family protein [Nannocystaceae bacterium]